MVNPNRDMGPGDLDFKGASLGESSTMKFGAAWAVVETKNAKFGVTPTDGFHGGVIFAIESTLAETSLANLRVVIPASTVLGSRLTINNATGLRLRDLAGPLIFKPLEANAARTVQTEWVTFPVASPAPDFEQEYHAEGGQRLFKVMWKIYPVRAEDLASGGQLYNTGNPQWVPGDLGCFGPVINL